MLNNLKYSNNYCFLGQNIENKSKKTTCHPPDHQIEEGANTLYNNKDNKLSSTKTALLVNMLLTRSAVKYIYIIAF